MENEKWNIDAHIKNHSDFYFNKLMKSKINKDEYYVYDLYSNTNKKESDFEISKEDKKLFKTKSKYLHFVFSFSLADFTDEEEAYRILKKLLKKLMSYELEVEESKGIVNGKRYYRKRKIKIGKELIAGAIHTRSFDTKWLVNPHIHLIFTNKARLGKNFMYLKRAISNIKKELNIEQKTNFEIKDPTKNINLKFKKVMNARGWAIRQGKNVKKKTLELFEQDLIKYLYESKNLEYALKNFMLLEEKGKELGFYPTQLQLKIEEFIYSALNFGYGEELNALIKILKKEKFYIRKHMISPFRHFFILKMDVYGFEYEEYSYLVYNIDELEKKGHYAFIEHLKQKEEEEKEETKSRGMSPF